ncbi:unnamed protein product, partial [Iphiclides podalirius]
MNVIYESYKSRHCSSWLVYEFTSSLPAWRKASPATARRSALGAAHSALRRCRSRSPESNDIRGGSRDTRPRSLGPAKTVLNSALDRRRRIDSRPAQRRTLAAEAVGGRAAAPSHRPREPRRSGPEGASGARGATRRADGARKRRDRGRRGAKINSVWRVVGEGREARAYL